jgi:tetratricopeptide (TPR) repeat protein
MEKLLPGDPEVLLQRSRLAEQRGQWDAALRDLRTAAERAPSWRNLFWLARLEGRRGQLPTAREHFAAVLQLTPGNPWAQEELAQIEMEHGDLARAERLFSELALASPRRNRFTNLGGVHFLRGRYDAAAAAFRRALEIDPDHTPTLTNLGEAEVELGHPDAATALYGRALARIEKEEKSLGLSPALGMRKASCLARLGRSREAASLVQEVLRRDPDNPDLLYGAAFVYSVVGDRTSALGNAEAALAKGKSPRWFTGSAFRPVLADPELRGLLKSSAPRGTAAAPP